MTMYTLKPIFSLPQMLHHTKTMYEMRNIHGEQSSDDHTESLNENVPDIAEQVINFLKSPLPEYNALKTRQNKILTQLAELKQQVSVLSNLLKQTNQLPVSGSSHKIQEAINVNLIINVNPNKSPYFLSALQKTWTDTDIRVQTYVHSSINKAGPIVHQLATNSSRRNIINLSLIWKDVEDLELVLGLSKCRIIGETNFLRYLSRLLNSHNYESSVCLEKVNTIDLILDLCFCLNYKEQKQKQETLSLIADKLIANWNDNKKPDIADIAAWSTIKQICPNKYPSKLNRWFEACEKLFV